MKGSIKIITDQRNNFELVVCLLFAISERLSGILETIINLGDFSYPK